MEAIRLGNEAEKLHTRVDNTELLIKQYESQVQKDVNVTHEVNVIRCM